MQFLVNPNEAWNIWLIHTQNRYARRHEFLLKYRDETLRAQRKVVVKFKSAVPILDKVSVKSIYRLWLPCLVYLFYNP